MEWLTSVTEYRAAGVDTEKFQGVGVRSRFVLLSATSSKGGRDGIEVLEMEKITIFVKMFNQRGRGDWCNSCTPPSSSATEMVKIISWTKKVSIYNVDEITFFNSENCNYKDHTLNTFNYK